MDPLEIFNGICARESESPPNLPDVDIQLLVNANFNNTAAEDPNTSLQLRTVTDDALCPSHDLNDGQPLLDFEVIGNLSLHNNGDSQETQLDKEAIMAYLIDSKGEGLAATTGQSDPALMLPFPSSRQFHEGDPKRETTPQTTYNSEHNAHTPPSVVTQGEWKNLDSQASKNVFDPIPPSMMNGVKMVSLDQEPTNTFHSPQELPPRDTNHRADEVNLTLPINMWQSSPNPTPLILRQKSTVPFQLPITVPQTTLYTENQSLKAAKAPMKQNKRKGSKAKKGTPSSSHEIQSNENEFASSTNLTKKAMGRRKVCDLRQLCLITPPPQNKPNSDRLPFSRSFSFLFTARACSEITHSA